MMGRSCYDIIFEVVAGNLPAEVADELLKQDGVMKRMHLYRKDQCYFCESPAWTILKVTVCKTCGLSLSKKSIEESLIDYNLDLEDLKNELLPYRLRLVELLINSNYNYVSKVIAYHYYKLRNYRRAREILYSMGAETRQKFRRVVMNVFGKNFCLNDCIINMFIEKCEENNIDSDIVDEGVAILRRIGERYSLTRAICAGVFHLVTGWYQEEVAKTFGVTSVSIRNNLKKYGLGKELFIERAKKYGLSEEEINKGVKMLDEMSRMGKIVGITEVASVFYLITDMTAKEVADIFKVSKNTIIHKCGFSRRRRRKPEAP